MSLDKPIKYLKLLDYVNLAIYKDFMIWILITSGARGKLPTLYLDYGAGKSTRALWFLCKHVYAGSWEKVKRNTIGAYWEIKPVLDRPYVTLGLYMDDMQLTLGKDKQHNPAIKELAYYMMTVRPYIKIFVASAPHRGTLHKDFREMFHFEIICPSRGRYEVQQLRRLIDWKKPMNVKERMRFKGQGRFTSLPPEVQGWYDKWRDAKNREIRSRLSAFKGEARVELNLGAVAVAERDVLDYVKKEGFVRYETLQRKGLALLTARLRRRGWLEVDKNRRIQLTADAEEVLLK